MSQHNPLSIKPANPVGRLPCNRNRYSSPMPPAAAASLKARWPSSPVAPVAGIIGTASVNAYKGNSHLIAYTATKGAIVAFTRSIALPLAERDIRVNGVAPGPVWTPLIPATFQAEAIEEFGSQVPMQRPGQPSEIAPSYVFLASADASYMTGQILHPNGGYIVNA